MGLVVAAGGHEAMRSATEDAGGGALIVADFSFHPLGRVEPAQVRFGFC
jgi:hypothetical protein